MHKTLDSILASKDEKETCTLVDRIFKEEEIFYEAYERHSRKDIILPKNFSILTIRI